MIGYDAQLKEMARVYFAAHQAIKNMRTIKSEANLRSKSLFADSMADLGVVVAGGKLKNRRVRLIDPDKQIQDYVKRYDVVATAAALEGYNGIPGATQMLAELYGLDPTLRDKTEKYLTSIGGLGERALRGRIRNIGGMSRLYFRGDLDKEPVERLRHILLAALVNAKPPR